MAAALDLDKLYRQLGRPGCYQICMCLLLYWNVFPIVINHLAMAIIGTTHPHHCRVPEGRWLNESIPVITDNGHAGYEKCKAYQNFSVSSNKTQSCTMGYEYDTEARESTIVTQFDLVCENAYLAGLATTIYFCGVMVGGIFFGTLSDRFGRKPFMLLTLYLHILVGAAIPFSPTYIVFVVLRFMLGILIQGLHTCTFVLMMELLAPEYRTVAATVLEVFWGIGVILLGLVSYFIRDWRYIQLTFAVVNVFTIIFIWVIPESLRWLIIHDKKKQVDSLIQRIAKFNRISVPHDALQMVQKIEYPNNYSLVDMFKTPQLRKRSIVLFYLWFVVAVGYYGLSLSITSLAGNKYFNLMIGGMVELSAYIAAVFILQKFGRRRPLCIYLLIGGIMCIAAGLVPTETASGKDISMVSTGLAITGRFGMSGCFSVILLYTSELYPTVIRNASVGACMFWGRLGGVLAPQVLQLGLYTFPALPVMLFGILSLGGSLVVCLLPETLHSKLPDSIEEAEGVAVSDKIVANGQEMSMLNQKEPNAVDV